MTALRYTVSGPGQRPVVLFLHGFMGSSADWSDIARGLEGAYRCVAPDLPGHGGSVGLPYPGHYTMEGAAREVLGVLDGLGVREAVIVGYSMGGRLALYLALRHPERCRAVVVEGASPGLEDRDERARRRAADERKARRLEGGDLEGFLRDWYRQPLFASLASDAGLLDGTIEARSRNDPVELARSLRCMGTGSQPSLWGELAGLGVPALAVSGELDEKFGGISRRMAAVSPLVRAVTLAGAGHNTHGESPESYLSLIRDFLASL